MTAVVDAPGRSATEQAALRSLRVTVRAFLADDAATHGWKAEPDAWQSGFDPDFSRRLGARGFIGMTVPTEYGGHGMSQLERFVVIEELLAAGAPVAAHWIADRQMATGILNNGTEVQKESYLPGIVSGERFFGIGMSEPDAGSDLAAVRTRAVEADGGWRLTGTKLWTSGAHIATNLVVLARTDSGDDRHAGLSQFIVDLPHPAIEIRPIGTIDGGHHFNEVVFLDAFVPAGNLLGARGDGWRQVTRELANERSGPERFLTTFPLLQAFAATTVVSGNPHARRALGGLLGTLAVLREMSFDIAQLLANGGDAAVRAAMVKDLGTQFEVELVDVVRRYAGTPADPTKTGLPGMLALTMLRAPSFTLRGGANEILRSIVAKGLGAHE